MKVQEDDTPGAGGRENVARTRRAGASGSRHRRGGRLRTWRLILVGATGLILAAGCTPATPPGETAPLPVLPPPGEGPPDGVELAVYLVSYGTDRAAARFAADYWAEADEEVAAPDTAALWRANGLRLGRAKAEVVGRARDLLKQGPEAEGGRCTVGRLRVPHRGSVILLTSQAVLRGTFLLTLPGQRTVVRSLPGASVALGVTCRVIDEDTAYLEFAPKMLGSGREGEDGGLLDFLATEVACTRSEAVLIGTGSPTRYTAGRTLLTSGFPRENVERLLLIAAEPVCLSRSPAAGKE